MTTLQPLVTTPLERFFWTWQGHQIQYTVRGTGFPLVLVHGFGASIGHWRKNIPVLAEAGYRVFALDLLGFGASDKPPLDYSLELWEQLLKDFWTEKIKTPTVWVGNSIGALMSLMILVDFPEMAAGGILINSAGGLNHRPEELNFPLRQIMKIFTNFVSSPIVGPVVFNFIRQKHRIRDTLTQVYRDRSAITDELVEMLYQPSCDAGAQKVFASIITAPPGPKPETLVSRLEFPLLVLWGDEDPWTPITGGKIYQDWATKGKDIEFYPLQGAGHCPHDEQPEQVNKLILDWLGRSRPL